MFIYHHLPYAPLSITPLTSHLKQVSARQEPIVHFPILDPNETCLIGYSATSDAQETVLGPSLNCPPDNPFDLTQRS